MRVGRRLVFGATVAFGLIVATATMRAQSAGPQAGPPAVLQVPYVPQSELLCGGAAIAMVERWWGRRGVDAEPFRSLVRPALGGILTTDLAQATRALGWRVQVVRGTPALVEQSLRDSVPVVALLQVAAHRYHYVVIVGWGTEQVVFHDPAVAPFATLTVGEFLKRWNGADLWAMTVRPPATVAASVAAVDDPATSGIIDSLPCRPWLDQAADAAAADRLEDADHFLSAAATACPSEPLVLRELAGVRFRQGRPAEATHLADEYLRVAPADVLGWQLLASSRYLAGDATGALEAWNMIGRPVLDLVRIDGTRHVRFRALADAMATPAGVVLTPARIALARRRLGDVPALAHATVTYVPVAGGVVELRAAVVERPVIEPIPWLVVAGALRAAVRQDAQLSVATPIGAGEEWSAQWRWESADPRRAIRLDIPTTIGVPGIVGLESSWDQYRFAGGVPAEQRRAATFAFGSWIRPDLETLAAVRFERWSGQGDFLALSAGGAVHKLRDRLVLIAQGEQAVPLTGRAPYTSIKTQAAWLPAFAASSFSWSARLGVDWTSANAPRALWPIAGGSLTREIPLRAHPLIENGVLATGQTGQGIGYGGVAGDRPFATIGPVILAAGVFLDAARVTTAGAGATGSLWYLDGGAGLRVGLAGATGGALRVDLARGLATDPRWGVSVGFEESWPPRLRGFR